MQVYSNQTKDKANNFCLTMEEQEHTMTDDMVPVMILSSACPWLPSLVYISMHI